MHLDSNKGQRFFGVRFRVRVLGDEVPIEKADMSIVVQEKRTLESD